MRERRGIILRRIITVFGISAVAALCGCSSAGHLQDKCLLRAVSFCGDNAVMEFFSGDTCTVPDTGDIPTLPDKAGIITGKKLLTGHTALVILSSGTDTGVLEDMLLKWKVSPECMVAVSDGCITDSAGAEQLIGSVRQAQEQGMAPECDIVTVLGGLLSDEGSTEVPLLSSGGYAGNALLTRDG